MFLYTECNKCGLRRHASINEVVIRDKNNVITGIAMKTYMCPCKQGVLQYFKTNTYPDIPEGGYAIDESAILDGIPTKDAAKGTATKPPIPLVIPDGIGSIAEKDAVAPSAPVAGPGAKPVESEADDAAVQKAWDDAKEKAGV